jgi:hypothetical protein
MAKVDLNFLRFLQSWHSSRPKEACAGDLLPLAKFHQVELHGRTDSALTISLCRLLSRYWGEKIEAEAGWFMLKPLRLQKGRLYWQIERIYQESPPGTQTYSGPRS